MQNFWHNLPKPFFCLAPMEEVTDFAFREMFARYSGQGPRTKKQVPIGNSFVMFTEFLNVDGLLHPEGFEKLKIDLKFSEAQRPIVAQIWGRDPEKFFRAAQLVASLGFDGIDINMGCPQSKEIAGGTCAALIREPQLAQEIIQAVKQGAGGLPVSVKTRLGYSKTEEMEGWVRNILEMDVAALTLHGRTKQEMSKVPAHWDKIAEAVEIRNHVQGSRAEADRTLIIGNGDVKSREDGLKKIQETKVDGVMVARGAFGNPWFFNPSVVVRFIEPQEPDKSGNYSSESGSAINIQERFRVMLEHAKLFEQTFAGKKSFVIMRKHFKAYCSGFPGAHELRAKLMETKNLEETKSIVEEYLKINTINTILLRQVF